MFKYYGNIRTPRAPYMDENTKNHEEANVNKWWEALTKYADKEIEISRDLNKYPDTLFFLNDKGKMTPAIGKNEDMSSPAVRQRLLNQARNNRLFISALDDIRPRQIITDDKYRVSFTKPIVDDLPEPKEQLPEKPRRPFFLKYLVRFAFKEEFKAYDEKKKIYDNAVKRRELIEKFSSYDNGKIFEKAKERDRKDESLRSRIEMRDAAELKKINDEIRQKEEQKRREKEKELEEEKLLKVINNGKEKAKEEQRKMKDFGDIDLDNSMKMGMVGLGHKDFAKRLSMSPMRRCFRVLIQVSI